MTASALVTTVGNVRQFRNGRQMAAFLGLVPRQHSSGGKARLLGIHKRGDSYCVRLFHHGQKPKASTTGRIYVRNLYLRHKKRLANGRSPSIPWSGLGRAPFGLFG